MVQESLTNAARYARGADRVRVVLARTRTCAVVTVQDSGGTGKASGVDWATSGGGYGIVGMRKRVGGLGGSLDAWTPSSDSRAVPVFRIALSRTAVNVAGLRIIQIRWSA